MTKEYQEMTNEYLKVRFHILLCIHLMIYPSETTKEGECNPVFLRALILHSQSFFAYPCTAAN